MSAEMLCFDVVGGLVGAVVGTVIALIMIKFFLR